MPPARITFVSFISYTFSHNIGFSLLTGGSIRYRIYSSWGLTAEQIARLTAFAAFSFILGISSIGGLILLLSPAKLPAIPYFPLKNLWPIGALALAGVFGYLLLTFIRRRPLRLRGWQIPLPPFRQALGQILLGGAEWTVTASVLYPLLPETADLSLPGYLQIYLLAQLVALFSHVPGGLGIFESVFLLLVPGVPPPALFGSLIVYRTLYYLLPFLLGIILLTAFETLRHGKRFRRVGSVFGQWIAASGPVLLSAATLGSGAALLVLAAVPYHASWLPLSLPLPAVESLYWLSAMTGTALLLLARGVQRRLHSAVRSAEFFLLFGIVLSLLKGPEPWMGLSLALVLMALVSSRQLFHRRLSLLEEPYTPGWLAVILILFCSGLWLGSLFHRPLSLDLPAWFAFSMSAEASRFLRASAGAVLLLVVFAVSKKLHRPPARPAVPDAEGMVVLQRLNAGYPSAFGHLYLFGDKPVLFDAEKTAGLAFVRGERTLVCLGEGLGTQSQRQELFWRFREMCDREGKWPVFYGIGEEGRSDCLELGLSPLEFGQDVSIPLDGISPAAANEKSRKIIEGMRQAGYTFQIVPAGESTELPDKIRMLGGENRQGPRNLLLQGHLHADYLKRFPAGVLSQNGSIVAFAALPEKGESERIIDFVYCVPEAPQGSIGFLFASIDRWGREAGLSRLQAGIVPLMETTEAPLSPVWRQFGRFLYPHAEHFATLAELRAFKLNFSESGQMRYIACPDVLTLPEILADIARVAGGG